MTEAYTPPNLIADGVTPQMIARTDAKFALWDEVLREKMLDGSSEMRGYAMGLLLDPTIYMYAFFKDRKRKPLKLYAYQDAIINDSHRRIQVAGANQIGKSVTLQAKAIHYALTNPGSTTVIVSKTMPLSRDQLGKIKRILRSGSIDYRISIGGTDNTTELSFKHFDVDPETNKRIQLDESRIICVPATEGALSYDADLVLLDELAFYENGRFFYFQIAQPRTYTTKGQIISFSNTNGQQGIYWELWQDDDFHHYRFSFLDCPTNTREEYESLRRKLTRDEFNSTVEAVFTSPVGGFFSIEERRMMQVQDRPNVLPAVLSEPLYIFFDWGKVHDNTIRAAGFPVGTGEDLGVDVLELKEYANGTPYTEIFDDLVALINIYGFQNVAMVGWDNTGVGRGIEDFIKRIEDIGVQAMPVEFSLENKSRIYTIFKLLSERNVRGKHGVKMPYLRECDEQLSKLIFTRTERNYLKVHHEQESDRDDYPDALAGLCSLIVQPDSAPVTCTIIGADDVDVDVSAVEEADRLNGTGVRF